MTGGSSEIDEVTVRLFIDEGAKVLLIAQNEERSNKIIGDLGENAIFYKGDITIEDDVKTPLMLLLRNGENSRAHYLNQGMENYSSMSFCLFGLEGFPYVAYGDDIARLIYDAAFAKGLEFHDKDIVVVTQKIVSKAEGRVVRLEDVVPSSFAIHIGEAMEKDPRLAELVLRETARIIRMKGRTLIVETHHGHVCANAGIDFSNVEEGYLTLLPVNPDASAERIREDLMALTGKKLAVIITDTWGRAWRLGQVDFAIGVAGMSPFRDYRGERDYMGHELYVTNLAVADELAAAAELVKGKSSGVPVVIIRGYDYPEGEGKASDIIRPIDEDLFR